MLLATLSLALAHPVVTTPARTPPAGTMHLRGRHLYTAAGERVVLRGVNEMFSVSRDPTGAWSMAEIAKSGANAVRIFTTPAFPPHDLDTIIGNAVRVGMVPMVECHAATGKWEKLGECVDYWTRPDVAAVVAKHRRWVLLNIANEAGTEVARDAFVRGYTDAIGRIRRAGIDVPLVVDGSDWGKEYAMLLDSWSTLNAADPLGQVMVSAHSYWVGTDEERKAPYRAIIARVTRDDIPFVLGEGPTPSGWDCRASPYEWAMTELDRADIGWLAWSWGVAPNGDCRAENRYDLTEGGIHGRWKSAAAERIVVGHPASIRNTARRPCSIPNAGQRCVRAEPRRRG